MYRPQLTKDVYRTSKGSTYEQGERRQIILVLSPPAQVGFRLVGTRQTYFLDAEVGYAIAVKRFLVDVERRAKLIKKELGCSIKSARSRARRELLQQ